VPTSPFITHTDHKGERLRTAIDGDHRVRWGGGRENALLGDGSAARTIRALGLHETIPRGAFQTIVLRSILPAGTVIP
jgi:hypothetical protein